MPNFQYIPYTLIAVGLINAVYRNSDNQAVDMSYVLIIVGAILFLASRAKALSKFRELTAVKWGTWILSGLLIAVTLIK